MQSDEIVPDMLHVIGFIYSEHDAQTLRRAKTTRARRP